MISMNENLTVKPDNIDFDTASKNVVFEADGAVQVRSSQNWMDRLEKSVSGADAVDYRNRSVGKYLDVMDGRNDLSPIININKDITRYEPEMSD